MKKKLLLLLMLLLVIGNSCRGLNKGIAISEDEKKGLFEVENEVTQLLMSQLLKGGTLAANSETSGTEELVQPAFESAINEHDSADKDKVGENVQQSVNIVNDENSTSKMEHLSESGKYEPGYDQTILLDENEGELFAIP